MTQNFVIPQIGQDLAYYRHPEDGEMCSRRVYWVYLEIEGRRFDHEAMLNSFEAVEKLSDRIFHARLSADHFQTSPHWSEWTNPYAGDLEPFGPAWQDEQCERLAA